MIATGRALRSYPQDSAEAAARIVALALIANGRIKAVEAAALEALRANERLGLTRAAWHGVIHDLCRDLLGSAAHDNDCCVAVDELERVLDEVQDQDTRRLVLRLCSAVVHADRQVDEGESYVVLAAIERWGLHPDDQALLEPLLYGTDFQVRARGQDGRAGARLRLR